MKEKLKQQALKIYREKNKLYKSDFFKYCDKSIVNPKMINEYFESFNDFLIFCNLPINKTRNISIEKVNEEILNVFKIVKQNKELFKDSSLRKYSNITTKVIYKHYQTFDDILKTFDEIKLYNDNLNVTIEDAINEIIKIHNECKCKFNKRYYINNSKYSCKLIKYFGTYQKAIDELKLTSNIIPDPTREEYLNEIKNLYDKFGYMSIELLGQESKFKTKGLRFLKQFGGYINILDELNIENKNNGYKRANLILDYASKYLNENVYKEKTWDWLVNPNTGYKLRVDGYFEKNNIVIECNGRQHYEFYKYYHNTIEQFNKYVELFEIKKNKILEHNIIFIEFDHKEKITYENVSKKINEKLSNYL